MTQAIQDILPDEWEDDVRMNSLFLQFRDANLNPRDRLSKISFWSELILKAVKKLNLFSFDSQKMMEVFTRKGSQPRCLNGVLEEMIRTGQLVPRSKISGSFQNSWISWGLQTFVTRPLSWGVSKVTGSTSDSALVSVAFLKEKAEELQREFTCSPDAEDSGFVVEFSVMCKQYSHICTKPEDFMLLLGYLQREKKVILQEAKGLKLVKFSRPLHETASTIHSDDWEKVTQQQRIKSLREDIDSLTVISQKLTAQAKEKLNVGDRGAAKRLLLSRRKIQHKLNQREAVLENLEAMKEKCKEVHENKQVIDAYRANLDQYKKMMKDSGLTEDLVNDTMDELQDAMQTDEDLRFALNRSVASDDVEDTEELEQELSRILAEDEAQLLEPDLESPDLPTDLPEPPGTEADDDLMKLEERLARLRTATPDVPRTVTAEKAKPSLLTS